MSTGHKIQLKMFMGKTLKTHATAEATFAANYTSASVNVFGGAAGKILALPDLGNPTKPGADAPFVFVPLDTVYTHDSSQNLAVEWQVLANDNGNAPWLYTLDSGSFIAKTAKIGSGCPSSANVIPTLTSTQAAIGGNYAVYLSGAPAGNPTALALSLKAASAPIRHPGYALGCNLHIDLGPTALLPVFFLGTTSTSGSFSWNFPVPNDRRLNDLQLYSQAVIADFFASGGGVLSDAGMAELGMNPQQAMISATGDPNAASGSVSKFRGLITHFIHN
jgi:hypothetical protein